MATRERHTSELQYDAHPFKLSIEHVTSQLETSVITGLTKSVAESRRTTHGENKLAGQAGAKWYSVLLKQISNAMILVSVKRQHMPWAY